VQAVTDNQFEDGTPTWIPEARETTRHWSSTRVTSWIETWSVSRAWSWTWSWSWALTATAASAQSWCGDVCDDDHDVHAMAVQTSRDQAVTLSAQRFTWNATRAVTRSQTPRRGPKKPNREPNHRNVGGTPPNATTTQDRSPQRRWREQRTTGRTAPSLLAPRSRGRVRAASSRARRWSYRHRFARSSDATRVPRRSRPGVWTARATSRTAERPLRWPHPRRAATWPQPSIGRRASARAWVEKHAAEPGCRAGQRYLHLTPETSPATPCDSSLLDLSHCFSTIKSWTGGCS